MILSLFLQYILLGLLELVRKVYPDLEFNLLRFYSRLYEAEKRAYNIRNNVFIKLYEDIESCKHEFEAVKLIYGILSRTKLYRYLIIPKPYKLFIISKDDSSKSHKSFRCLSAFQRIEGLVPLYRLITEYCQYNNYKTLKYVAFMSKLLKSFHSELCLYKDKLMYFPIAGRALLHGGLTHTNVLFSLHPIKVALLDFEGVREGIPLLDILLLLISSIYSSIYVLPKHGRDLRYIILRFYLGEMYFKISKKLSVLENKIVTTFLKMQFKRKVTLYLHSYKMILFGVLFLLLDAVKLYVSLQKLKYITMYKRNVIVQQ